jgi:integral membrane protein (TIGR01906 family)
MSALRTIIAFLGTVLVIIALAVLPLLTPPFTHAALDAAGSAALLGVTPTEAHELSDRSVHELLLGPGTFAIAAVDGQPLYDAAERSHLADARALLWLCLTAGLASSAILGWLLLRASTEGRARLWCVISRAGLAAAVAVVAIGLLSTVAFGSLFVLFHELVFPAGGWAFDPASQRLVQLYPFAFWQLTAAAFGALVLVLGSLAWLLGRSMARRERWPWRPHRTPETEAG